MAEHLASVVQPGDLFIPLEHRSAMYVAALASASGQPRIGRCCSRVCISHRAVWRGAARETSAVSVLQFAGAL